MLLQKPNSASGYPIVVGSSRDLYRNNEIPPNIFWIQNPDLQPQRAAQESRHKIAAAC